MNTKTTLSISEARSRIFDIAKEIQNPSVYYTLTERGRPKAVIISAQEFESFVETLEVMKDFPNLETDIEMVKKDYKSGRYKTYPTMKEILQKIKYIDKKQSKQTNEVRNKIHLKSRKRIK